MRRLTGYSAKDYVLAHVRNPLAKGAASAFFNAGEAIVFGTLKWAEVMRASREAKLSSGDKKSGSDSGSDSSKKHD